MRLFVTLAGVILGAVVLIPGVPGQTQSPLRLTSPRDGAVVSGTVPILADAATELGVSFVVFGIDGERPVATNSRPFVCSWDTRTYADGAHVLFVEAHGAGGLVASAGPIHVIVRNRPVAAALPVPRGPIAARVIPAPSARTGLLTPPRRQPCPEVSVVLGGAPMPARIKILEGEAYLPVRPLVERLGGEASWEPETHTVTLWCRDHEAQVTVGSVIGTLDGTSIRLWRPPTLDAGRTILTARSCAQLLDLDVAWEALTRVIRMGLLPSRPATGKSSTHPAG